MFDVPETVLLTGVSKGQLQYWRGRRAGMPPVLEPSLRSGHRIFYSFEDLVALRMFAWLRGRVSLPKLRIALQTISRIYPDSHPSEHSMLARQGDRTIVHLNKDGEYIDLVEHPGQAAFEIVMAEIYEQFTNMRGTEVPALMTPVEGIRIDPAVRGGQPCAEGTRVPYTAVAGLLDEGMNVADVVSFYPNVRTESVYGASELAERVALAA